MLAHQYPHQMTDWTLALLLAWSASSIILMFYEQINRMLGDRVLQALERLMGMLLVMISVQMLLDGAVKYLS